MSNIIVLSSELDLDLVEVINNRKEDNVCIIDDITDLRIIRGIEKEVFSLTEFYPLRFLDLESLEDSIILSDKSPDYFHYLFEEDVPLNFYYKQRGIKTSFTMDTAKEIKNKKVDKNKIKVIGDDFELEEEYRNILELFNTERFNTTSLSTPQLRVDNDALLTKELSEKMSGNLLDLSDKDTVTKLQTRFFSGTPVSIGTVLIPFENFPSGSYFTNNDDYNSVLFNFDLSLDTDKNLKLIMTEIKALLEKKELGYIYVLNQESKELLSRMSLPKAFIKII